MEGFEREPNAADTAYTTEQAAIYDEIRFRSAAGLAIHQTEVSLLEEALKDVVPGGRVLEIGCGTGRLLRTVASMGFRAEGLDASPAMLAEARKQVPDATFFLGEASEIPMDSGTYDFVYAVRLLNQTSSQHYALRVVDESLRLTAPGGFALIEFVNSRRPIPRWWRPKTVRLASKQVLERAQRSGGELAWRRGAFLGGMTLLDSAPRRLVQRVARADRAVARLLNGACARIYILFRKHAEQEAD